jgi:Ribosomal protein L15
MMLTARLARKRGFTNKWRTEYEWVNVGQLSKAAQSGKVSPESLVAAGIISRPHLPLKVLGDGQLDQALTVTAHAFTAGARQKIEAAGGRAEQLAGHATERASRLEAAKAEAEQAAAASTAPPATTEGEPSGEPANNTDVEAGD